MMSGHPLQAFDIVIVQSADECCCDGSTGEMAHPYLDDPFAKGGLFPLQCLKTVRRLGGLTCCTDDRIGLAAEGLDMRHDAGQVLSRSVEV